MTVNDAMVIVLSQLGKEKNDAFRHGPTEKGAINARKGVGGGEGGVLAGDERLPKSPDFFSGVKESQLGD